MRGKRISSRIAAIALILAVAFSSTVAYGAEITRPTITAKSAVVLDGDTGEVLYAKNPNIKRDPVSTTKLLTALVVMDHLDLNQKVTVSKVAANTPGSSAYIKRGEKLRVKDLLYGALLPSGNDAAVALAEAVAGSKKKFAVLMNEKAEELGCTNSHFTNPHGWKASAHYSTAYDMALITKAAMENETIREICSTEVYKIPKTNKQKARKISTTNYFVAGKKYKNPGVFAGKTGTWDSRNAALVSMCERDGKILYAAVLRSTLSGRYTDTNKILNYSYKLIG